MSDQSLNEKGKMPKKFSVKSGDKSKAGGLTAKGVKRYRAANPGSKLKTAVTTKPSKLKKGSKAANRRKSFCARMGGMKKRLTSAKTRRDPDSRINKALRKWNCSTDVNPNMKASIAEAFRDKNPYAICTASVGRDNKSKYERCVKSVKKESISVIAEKCWVGWKQQGLKKKGNRMVPNCVKEEIEKDAIDTDVSRITKATKKAKEHGGDPVKAADKVVARLYQAGDQKLQPK